MIYFTMFLLGGILGIALWFYLSGFITRLQQNIYAIYVELFPQNRSPFQPHFASIQQKKVRSYFEVFFLVLGLDLYFYKLPSKILFLLYGSDSHLLFFGQSVILIGTINLFLRHPVYGYLL